MLQQVFPHLLYLVAQVSLILQKLLQVFFYLGILLHFFFEFSYLQLGADHLINYKKKDFEKEVLAITNEKGVDVLIDCVGASNWNKNLSVMAMDGRLVIYGFLSGSKLESTDLAPILRKRLQVTGTTLRNREESYKVLLCQELVEKTQELFNEKKLIPVIDKIFPYSHASAAHEYMESNSTQGKVILRIEH